MFRRDIEIKKIVIATGRTDMRKGIDGLVSLIRLKYFMDPLEVGAIFLFCGRRKNKIKGLAFEGDCLLKKELSVVTLKSDRVLKLFMIT